MALVGAGAIKVSTAESTLSCLKQFTFCVDKIEGVHNIHINNRYADFKLWADSLGAIAQGQACLDWRFRDRPEDILFIKGLLEMLEWFLKECASSSGNVNAVEEALDKIDSMVHNLISIGVAIRRSGRKSRLQKADDSFERHREKYLDLRAHLACVIVSKPNKGPRTPCDSDHFATMVLPPIQNRLVEANLRRRHRFLEAQRHSHLLKDPTPTIHGHLSTEPGINEILSTLGTKLPSENQGIPKVEARLERAQAITAARIDPITTPGTIASTLETGFQGLQHKVQARSTVTCITKITAAARYPRAKTSGTKNFSFKCPCCCQAISTKEAEDSQFRKHLANDISPYTCILENCPTPYKLFVTEKEWNEHFLDTHPPKFQCIYCESTTLDSLARLMSHFQVQHPEISDDDFADSLAKSAVHVMGITKCPLCDSEDSPDSPELIEHILEHIHDFSLRSLPWCKDPMRNLNKVAGTFDVTVQDVNRIIQWVDKSSPKEELQLQLSSFDKNSPVEEGTASKHSKVDYFTQNDYFTDESSDGRFVSKSGQSYMLSTRSRPSATSKRVNWEDMETEAFPMHVPHVHGVYESDDLYGPETHSEEKPTAEAKAEEFDEAGYLTGINFSPDGKQLVSASTDDRVELWDIETGAALQMLEGHSDCATSVAFSPDNKVVASGSRDATVRLWDAATGAALQVLEGHLGGVTSVAFSPDGKIVASGSWDATVRLWDAATGAARHALEGHLDQVTSVAFSLDGRFLASVSADEVKLWDARSKVVLQTLSNSRRKRKTEKDFRNELTIYEVYKISPSKILGSEKKEMTEKDKKDKKDKGTSEKKGSWTEALQIQQFFKKKDIETTIKRLDARDSATKKMKELGPNQTAQISYILDNKMLQDRDRQFEWIVAQLERDFYPADKNGKKFTRSITVYLKRCPKDNVNCMDLVQRRKMQERQHLLNQRMVQQQQQQAQQQQHHMRMQQAIQEHAERMKPTRMMGPGDPGMPVRGGGRGPGVSAAGVRIVEMSDSDGKSISTDTNSDSGQLGDIRMRDAEKRPKSWRSK